MLSIEIGSEVQGSRKTEPQNRRISNIECRRVESLRSIFLEKLEFKVGSASVPTVISEGDGLIEAGTVAHPAYLI